MSETRISYLQMKVELSQKEHKRVELFLCVRVSLHGCISQLKFFLTPGKTQRFVVVWRREKKKKRSCIPGEYSIMEGNVTFVRAADESSRWVG